METKLAFDDETEVELKRCPRCELWLPLSEFGVCNARPDKMNLYDKRCIRQKIALSRLALREYRQSRGKLGNSTGANQSRQLTLDNRTSLSSRRIARMLRKLSPEDRVREAIRGGAHTQKEIALVTKLPKDDVCDVLANLLLWSKSIRTRMIRQTRMYFINEDGVTGIQREPVRPRESRSYGVSNIYELGDPEIGKGMSTYYLHKKCVGE